MAMTACDQGVFEIEPPEQRNEKWIVRKVLDKPVSDIALVDINDDGIAEMAAIEPFHGSDFTVYQMTKEGYTPIYRYPEKLEFCHAIWGGKVRNETVFNGGSREGRRELFMLRYINGSIKHEISCQGFSGVGKRPKAASCYPLGSTGERSPNLPFPRHQGSQEGFFRFYGLTNAPEYNSLSSDVSWAHGQPIQQDPKIQKIPLAPRPTPLRGKRNNRLSLPLETC